MSESPAPTTRRRRAQHTGGLDLAQPGRPLHLLIDLAFLAATVSTGLQLAQAIADNRPAQGLAGFVMVMALLWWGWVGQAWLSSAGEPHDRVHHGLLATQVVGALVLAAGVPAGLADRGLGVAVAGYVIARCGQLAQWVRVRRSDPSRASVALWYAVGVGVLAVVWLVRPLAGAEYALVTFLALMAAEVCLPLLAERRGHSGGRLYRLLARYRDFVVIVVGGAMLVTALATAPAVRAGLSAALVVFGIAVVALALALFWWYVGGAGLLPEGPASGGLVVTMVLGHAGVLAGLIGLGAALAAGATSLVGSIGAPDRLVVAALAVALVLFLVSHAVMQSTAQGGRIDLTRLVWLAVLLAAVVAATSWGLPMAPAVLGCALAVGGLTLARSIPPGGLAALANRAGRPARRRPGAELDAEFDLDPRQEGAPGPSADPRLGIDPRLGTDPWPTRQQPPVHHEWPVQQQPPVQREWPTQQFTSGTAGSPLDSWASAAHGQLPTTPPGAHPGPDPGRGFLPEGPAGSTGPVRPPALWAPDDLGERRPRRARPGGGVPDGG